MDAFPETVPPTVPLDKDLEALHEFLTHQGVPRGPHHREWIELASLSEKELETKVRELENWNFRLNLDEARELQQSHALGLAADASTRQR